MPVKPQTHKPARPVTKRHMVETATPTRYGQGRGGRPWRRKRDAVLKRDGYLCQCAECQTPGRLPKVAHEVDHIIPLAKGGTDDENNLRAINYGCHKKKTARESNGDTV